MVRQYFCDILWRWDLYLIQLMVSNLKEIPKKYSVGSRISDVPSNGILGGQVLRGEYILEYNPIPSKILDKANELKIIIRDSEGNVY